MNEYALPSEIEQRVLEILDGPESEWERMFDELCRSHPDHAADIEVRLQRMRDLDLDLDLELELDAERLSGHGAVPGEIGPFRVLERLGEGGMGTVYLAEQEQPIRRKVAVKVVKLGMDTRRVLQRFELERQALGLMSHRSVARVLEAGVTGEGRPYFAMEWVRGAPITEYCDAQRLGLRERLELFRASCAGVQHAHQKGIIHRDLKPSNVLVADEDGEPLPKIIDFGLARAVDRRAGEATGVTREGGIVGTPEYMSPEQLEGTGEDVDTRTDVYALGVLLYELLVGALPLDPGGLRALGPAELARRVREDQAPKPSTRLTRGDGWTAAAAERRRTDVPKLARALRGELDWIVMRALAKDRERRYQSVGDLAADVARYLNHEPVLARPSSVGYRLRKFLRRYRLQVAAAGAVLVVSVVGFIVSAGLYIEADARATQARAVTDFVVGMFEEAHRDDRFSAETPIRIVLETGSRGIRGQLDEHPAIRLELLDTIGRAQIGIGSYEAARQLYAEAADVARRSGDRAGELRARVALASAVTSLDRPAEAEASLRELIDEIERELGQEHELFANCLDDLAIAVHNQARYAEAEQLCGRAIALQSARGDLRRVASSRTVMATILTNQRRLEESLAAYDEALELLERVHPNEHADLLFPLRNRASLLAQLGRAREALETADRALAMGERLRGPEHPIIASILRERAAALRANGEHEESATVLRRALAIREACFGPGHREVARLLSELAGEFGMLSRFAEEHDALQRADQIWTNTGTGDHPDRAGHLGLFAVSCARRGDLDRALELAERGVAMWQRVPSDPPNPDRGHGLATLAFVHMQRREYDAAISAYRESLTVLETVPHTGFRQGATLGDLVVCLLRKGDHAAAVEEGELAIEELRRARPEGSRQEAIALNNIGEGLYRQRRFDEAEPWYRQSLELFRRLPSNQERELVSPLTMLAALAEKKDAEQALALWEEVVELRDRLQPPGDIMRLTCRIRLGRAHGTLGRLENAEEVLLGCYQELIEHHGAQHGTTVSLRKELAELYRTWNKPEKAARFADR